MISIKKYFFIAFVIFTYLFPKYSTAQSQGIDPEQMKSAFIYNFTKYIYWPHEDQMETFKICVLNCDKLTKYLNKVAELKQFRNRMPIEIIKCRTVNDIKPCQMLVVDGAGKDDLWAAYSKIRGKNTLMIAENLADYKKSMISLAEINGKVKYIVNKTKMNEANLVTNELFYTLAITKEGEWSSIFEKFEAASKNKDVSLDKSDVAQMMSIYRNLQNDNKAKSEALAQMEDSIRRKIEAYNKQIEEYNKLTENIAFQKNILKDQEMQMQRQRAEIFHRESLIGKQKNVITIITILGVVALLLFLFALRSNYLRRKTNKLLVKQKDELAHQKHLVDEKQKEIVDSINYAKRIQTALLANDRLLSQNLPEYFVMYKPKDIVAGDFYWAAPVHDGFIYITADCTGHGVPGAFMSLLNISKLNEAVNQKRITRPDRVLNEVKTKIIQALNPEGNVEESKDGMDAIICNLDVKNMKLRYAAANNSFCIVRNSDILVCKADKMPVGKFHDDRAQFTYNEIDLQSGDMIYTYTDGFEDQFGGEKGKKFKHKQLQELMLQVAKLPIPEQKQAFEQAFENWKGDLEQVDDVLLIGVRV